MIKNNKNAKKLTLGTHTIRPLADAEVATVGGGAINLTKLKGCSALEPSLCICFP